MGDLQAQRVRRSASDASEREARRAASTAVRREKVGALGAARSGEEAFPTHVAETVRSAGEPLDEGVRADLEPRFGHDFSRVRVHADGQAQRNPDDGRRPGVVQLSGISP